jgi:hypothetical protein
MPHRHFVRVTSGQLFDFVLVSTSNDSLPQKWFRSIKHGSFQRSGPVAFRKILEKSRVYWNLERRAKIAAALSLRIFNRPAQFVPLCGGMGETSASFHQV